MNKAAAGAGLLVASLLAASPAAACARTYQIRFEPGSTQVADSGLVAGFLQIPSFGARQRIIVSVSGPDGNLGRRRAEALSDLLKSYGLDPRGIMVESHTGSSERAFLLVYPPRPAPDAGSIARAPTPPRPACG